MSRHDDHEDREPRRRPVRWGERGDQESCPPASRGHDDGDEEDPRNWPAGPGDRPGDRPSQGDRPVDRPRRPAHLDRWKGGIPVWVWVLLGIGGLLSVGGGVLTLAVIVWGATAAQSGPGDGTPLGTPARVYSRDEFKALVVGKSGNEVLQTLGSPAESDTRGGGGTWTYRDVTRDPATGKTDPTATLRFEDSVVKAVDF